MEIRFQDLDDHAGFKLIEEACGSDYMGCSYTRANFEWFQEEYHGHADVLFLWGHFFGYGVAYRTETQDDRLREIVDGLAEYPCVDDEMVSVVEERWIGEAMESWALRDFRAEVEHLFGEDILDEVSDDTLTMIFDLCREESGEVWESENCGMHIRIVKIAPYFEVVVSNIQLAKM